MKTFSIVDSHVHWWNPMELEYSWLKDIPALNRTFEPAEFSAASAQAGVGKIIFVESGGEPSQSQAEVNWVSDLARQEPRLKGIVAQAALEYGKTARGELEMLAKNRLVKGVRRNLQGERELNFCLQQEFIEGMGLLAEFGLVFDACIRAEQLPEITELARRVPEVTIVLDHLGKPNVRGKKTNPWAADLEALATLPNVVCKISGLTTEANWESWRPDDLKFYCRHAADVFGFDRLLFGGDWPVATLATTYQRWVDTVLELFSFADEVQLTQLFQTNAEGIYHV